MKKYLIIFALSTFFVAYTQEKAVFLTPGTENIELALIDGEAVTEFSVFGFPSSVRNRRFLSLEERQVEIEEYIFEILLQKEGRVPGVLNSEEYKKNYSSLMKMNSAVALREDIISEKFMGGKKDDTAGIKKEKSSEIMSFIESFLDSLADLYSVEYNEDLFRKISGIKADTPEEFAEKIKNMGLNEKLVSWNNQHVLTSDIYRSVKNIKPYHLNSLSSVNILKRIADGPIINSVLAKEAEKRGYFNLKKVIDTTEDQLKYLVAKKYRDIITSDSKFIPTKDETVDYYIANKDDRSLWCKRKMWVYEIFKEYDNNDDNEDNDKIRVAIELENIRQKILLGESFEKYAKFYSRPYTRDGELGFIFEDDHAMVGKTASKMNEGDISELIVQQKAISIIKVTKVQEPMLYKFDYVDDIIRKRLIDQRKIRFLENYKKELFSKYKVEFIGIN